MPDRRVSVSLAEESASAAAGHCRAEPQYEWDTPYHFGFAVHGDLLCAQGKVGKSVLKLWEEVFFEADE